MDDEIAGSTLLVRNDESRVVVRAQLDGALAALLVQHALYEATPTVSAC